MVKRLSGGRKQLDLLLSLEVLEEDGTFLALLTPVPNNDAGAVDDLTRVSFTVKDAYTIPHQLAHWSHTFPSPQGNNIQKVQEQNKRKGNIHNPTHSPNIFPSGTLINGILCSEQSATTSFLYASSSQLSFSTHI